MWAKGPIQTILIQKQAVSNITVCLYIVYFKMYVTSTKWCNPAWMNIFCILYTGIMNIITFLDFKLHVKESSSTHVFVMKHLRTLPLNLYLGHTSP